MKFKTFLQGTTLLESKSKADEWLKAYTLSGLDKYPSSSTLASALEEYPCKAGTLYRGLNFSDVEHWEKFKEDTKNLTELDTGSISSWTPNPKEAYSFSVTRPTYFLNRELMQAEDEKNKNKDFMIGHAGVILKCTVKEGEGIDVNQSPHGKEQEVILPPGKYSIAVHKEMIPFMRSISKSNLKDEFLSITSIDDHVDDHDAKKFQHIMFHYQEFTPEMSSHLYQLIASSMDKWKHYVKIEKNKMFDKDSENYVNIAWNVPSEFFLYYHLLHKEDAKKIDTKLLSIVKDLNKEVEKQIAEHDLTKLDLRVKIDYRLELAMKQSHMADKFTFRKQLNKIAGDKYNQLNSRDSIKAINDIKDPTEKKKALYDYTQQILKAVSAIN